MYIHLYAVQRVVFSRRVFVSVFVFVFCICICAASGLHPAAWVLGCQVKSGLLCIPPLSPFCSGRPENCTLLRVCMLLWFLYFGFVSVYLCIYICICICICTFLLSQTRKLHIIHLCSEFVCFCVFLYLGFVSVYLYLYMCIHICICICTLYLCFFAEADQKIAHKLPLL